MSNYQLPPQRVFSSAVKEWGREDVVKIEAFPIRDGEVIELIFESQNSNWRQGVWLKTDEHLVVAQQQSPAVLLWKDLPHSGLDRMPHAKWMPACLQHLGQGAGPRVADVVIGNAGRGTSERQAISL